MYRAKLAVILLVVGLVRPAHAEEPWEVTVTPAPSHTPTLTSGSEAVPDRSGGRGASPATGDHELATPPPAEPPRYVPSARGTRQIAESLVTEERLPAWAVEWIVRTASCESRHDPNARSAGHDRRYGYYDYRGLMQIDEVIWGPRMRRLFGEDATLYNPAINLAMVAVILGEQGTRAWPVCGR